MLLNTVPLSPFLEHVKKDIYYLLLTYCIICIIAGAQLMFQGDSITECGRDMRKKRAFDHLLGSCYPFIISSQLEFSYPDLKIREVNHAARSSHNVQALHGNWGGPLKERFDVFNVLIGVRDAMADVGNNDFHGDVFEHTLDKMLKDVKIAHPNTTVIVLESFALPGFLTASHSVWNKPGGWNQTLSVIQKIQHQLAGKHNAIFLPLQRIFESASYHIGTDAELEAAHSVWLIDGMTPTYAGHQLIANAWLKLVRVQNPVLEQSNIKPSEKSKATVALHTNFHLNASQFSAPDQHGLNNSILKDKMHILFVGDSITDGYRHHRHKSVDEPTGSMGDTYAYLVAAELSSLFPEKRVVFTNAGIQQWW